MAVRYSGQSRSRRSSADGEREKHGRQPERHQSPGALAQIDATLTRPGERFEWGHIDEGAYLAEHARLTQPRDELQRALENPKPGAAVGARG